MFSTRARFRARHSSSSFSLSSESYSSQSFSSQSFSSASYSSQSFSSASMSSNCSSNSSQSFSSASYSSQSFSSQSYSSTASSASPFTDPGWYCLRYIEYSTPDCSGTPVTAAEARNPYLFTEQLSNIQPFPWYLDSYELFYDEILEETIYLEQCYTRYDEGDDEYYSFKIVFEEPIVSYDSIYDTPCQYYRCVEQLVGSDCDHLTTTATYACLADYAIAIAVAQGLFDCHYNGYTWTKYVIPSETVYETYDDCRVECGTV